MLHAHEAELRRVRAEKTAVIRLMDTIGERMTRGLDFEETLEIITQYVVGAAGAESGALYLLDESENRLRNRVLVGAFPPLFEDRHPPGARPRHTPERIRERRIELGEGIVGRALESREPILVTDAEADPRLPREPHPDAPVHTLMLAALRVRGRGFGVLAVANKRGDAVFDGDDSLLLQGLADQAAVTVDLVRLQDLATRQRRTEHELEIARDFQRTLLPATCPSPPGYEFAALSRPALQVGGDFHDFLPIDDEHLGFVIADVSGKGMPAALVMATVRAHLRAEARGRLSPLETLACVNEHILAETPPHVFVTVAYGILDLPRRTLRVVRAGHEPILVARAPETSAGAPEAEPDVRSYSPPGTPVGLMPADIFARTEEIEIPLREGDRVLLYTDGVIEAEDVEGRAYGRNRLVTRLRQSREKGAQGIVDDIEADVLEHSRGLPQHDDITVLALAVLPFPEAGPAAG